MRGRTGPEAGQNGGGQKAAADGGDIRSSPAWAASAAAGRKTFWQKVWIAAQVLIFLAVVLQFIMYRSCILAAAAALVGAEPVVNHRAPASSSTSSSSSSPDCFVTQPELYPGPTPTGEAAFLAQINPAPFKSTTYIPNTPLETQVPIVGNTQNGNIFQLHGQLSHYFPNPDGFGVDELPLPPNASIVQLNMLSRHGSRYPTLDSGAVTLGAKIVNATTGVSGKRPTFSGPLAFLNSWTYKLGAEILVPVGKSELFESGTLHQIMYGHLYPNNGSKIIVRSTTQDRMLKSAEYFLAGFFGLEWTQNATLVLAIENGTSVWNNTLAGYYNCPNSHRGVSQGGNNATKTWYEIYLTDAVIRLNSYSQGYTWTAEDVYNVQTLCAYETVALGYSSFCGLFTFEEWENYEYSVDLSFAGNNMFQSPTGRAVGVGYVAEILARLRGHLIKDPFAQINVTLDGNPDTFPLHQSLNFDFSHDTNIASVLTAFGLKQFAGFLPADRLERNRSLIVSHLTPFAARLDMVIIETPHPVNERRDGVIYAEGGTTKYIHFILNQRTIPLGKSFLECGDRADGWCELTTFLEVQMKGLEEAEYEYSCFGNYSAVPYGTLTNGVPQGV